MTDDQFVVLATLLAEIRDVLVQGVPAAEAPEAEPGCVHPDDKRVSLATSNQPDHWVCAICRFEHPGLTAH